MGDDGDGGGVGVDGRSGGVEGAGCVGSDGDGVGFRGAAMITRPLPFACTCTYVQQ